MEFSNYIHKVIERKNNPPVYILRKGNKVKDALVFSSHSFDRVRRRSGKYTSIEMRNLVIRTLAEWSHYTPNHEAFRKNELLCDHFVKWDRIGIRLIKEKIVVVFGYIEDTPYNLYRVITVYNEGRFNDKIAIKNSPKKDNIVIKNIRRRHMIFRRNQEFRFEQGVPVYEMTDEKGVINFKICENPKRIDVVKGISAV